MDPSHLQPGYRLDRYELLSPLAYGGMASVWLARFGGRLGFERLVVVKMILPQYSQDPRFKEMFLDEARIASRIEHSNVARILDVGEHEDNYFMVMEWVDGDSLSKLIRAAEQRETRVPLGVAMRVCADAAAGLHAAHVLADRDGTPLGVVHRDVSPQNLLIANSGATMLIDFGVAKARDRVSQETSAGQLKGKIRYMAPEQARGLPIDQRADVWALGAVLYELLAGVPPFEGTNEVATLHKLTSGTPPPPLADDVPEPLRVIVRRALSFEPSTRYASALEMKLALESAMLGTGEPTSTAMVAQYTGEVLADRKAARKKAVDSALARAQQNRTQPQAAGELPSQARTPGNGRLHRVETPSAVFVMPPAEHTAAILHAPVPPLAPRTTGSQPRPLLQTIPDAISLAESPSGASSATLGSASMEYVRPFDNASARYRRTTGILLGVSVAVAILGIVLIISVAMRNNASADAATNASSPTSTTASEDVPSAPSTALAAPIAEASSEPVSTVASDAAPTTTATSAPVGTPTKVVAHTATVSAPAHVRPAVTAAPAKPPPPKPATTAGKKDYGF